MFSYLEMLGNIRLLCSAFINHETEDCNPKFQLEMEYGERLGSVTGVRHFIINLNHETEDCNPKF